jgi:hypothetical protein
VSKAAGAKLITRHRYFVRLLLLFFVLIEIDKSTHKIYTTGFHDFAVRENPTTKNSRNTTNHLPCTYTRHTIHGRQIDGKGTLPCRKPTRHSKGLRRVLNQTHGKVKQTDSWRPLTATETFAMCTSLPCGWSEDRTTKLLPMSCCHALSCA